MIVVCSQLVFCEYEISFATFLFGFSKKNPLEPDLQGAARYLLRGQKYSPCYARYRAFIAVVVLCDLWILQRFVFPEFNPNRPVSRRNKKQNDNFYSPFRGLESPSGVRR